MLKSSECRNHAERCRRLATEDTVAFVRDDLLRTAATWDRLAEERERDEIEMTIGARRTRWPSVSGLSR
jgi:hypothetical protein